MQQTRASRVLPVEMKRERLNMPSALSRQRDLRFMLYEDPIDQQRPIQFLDRLVRASSRKVFLILYDLKAHYRKRPPPRLDRRRGKIELFFLPPYAPKIF